MFVVGNTCKDIKKTQIILLMHMYIPYQLDRNIRHLMVFMRGLKIIIAINVLQLNVCIKQKSKIHLCIYNA